MSIWRMRIAYWIPKATNTHTHTHTGCVILIAFPLQQWLHERVSTLRYTYVDSIVSTNLIYTSVKYIRYATYSYHLILIELVIRITRPELNKLAWIGKKQ